MGQLYDFCAYRASLKGRPAPRGEALAASVLRMRRAVEADERAATAFERLEREVARIGRAML